MTDAHDPQMQIDQLHGQYAVLEVSLMALIEALPDSMRVARAVDARLESFSALMLELRSEAAYQSFLDHRQQLVAGLLARGQ